MHRPHQPDAPGRRLTREPSLALFLVLRYPQFERRLQVRAARAALPIPHSRLSLRESNLSRERKATLDRETSESAAPELALRLGIGIPQTPESIGAPEAVYKRSIVKQSTKKSPVGTLS